MSGMFMGCASLISIDVSNFDTSNVKNMSWMFYMDDDLYDLPRLNEIIGLNSFETTKVTDMSSMFRFCNITELDLSGFDTSKVKTISDMFAMCSKLTTIYGNNWDTSSISYTNNYEKNIFNECNSLIGGDGTAYDSNHGDYTYAHIDGGTSNPRYFTSK